MQHASMTYFTILYNKHIKSIYLQLIPLSQEEKKQNKNNGKKDKKVFEQRNFLLQLS